MNQSAYNEFFLNYLKNDRTRRAIMLTAPWGTGKSFYAKNELKPFLDRKGFRCIVVSLYGLHSISEISKSIYLEIRAGYLMKKSEGKAIAGIIGKTIIKGISGYFGIPLEISDQDLEKLYSSIDLTGKLIVLEDLERSELDPVSVLGFVNGLVEEDGAKVLVIANEDEIVDKKMPGSTDNPFVKSYQLVKEKTVGDTIRFEPDIRTSVEAIVSSFGGSMFNSVSGKEALSEKIIFLMSELNDRNLRTLIFAIQKTVDIFSDFDDLDSSFIAQVFLGILAYSIRLNRGEKLKWVDENSARALGTAEHPLFRFAYNYINFQKLPDRSHLENCANAYRQEQKFAFEENKAKDAMSLLGAYYVHSEKEVKKAVVTLCGCLSSSKAIPIETYGKVMNYLAIIRDCLHDQSPIDECKKIMLENAGNTKLTEKTDDLFMKFDYSSGFQLETPGQIQEYNDFIKELKKTVLNAKDTDLGKRGQIGRFLAMAEEEGKYLQEMRLFAAFNPEEFAKELFSFSASMLDQVRVTFLKVYCSVSNIRDYLSGDLDNLQKLKEIIDNHIKNYKFTDLVIRKQFEYLSHNLGAAIANLGGH